MPASSSAGAGAGRGATRGPKSKSPLLGIGQPRPSTLADSRQVTQEFGVGGGATPHDRHLTSLFEHHVPHRGELINAVLAQQAVQVLAGQAAAAKLGVKDLAVGDQQSRRVVDQLGEQRPEAQPGDEPVG